MQLFDPQKAKEMPPKRPWFRLAMRQPNADLETSVVNDPRFNPPVPVHRRQHQLPHLSPD
jgi:hypothetical protein